MSYIKHIFNHCFYHTPSVVVLVAAVSIYSAVYVTNVSFIV